MARDLTDEAVEVVAQPCGASRHALQVDVLVAVHQEVAHRGELLEVGREIALDDPGVGQEAKLSR